MRQQPMVREIDAQRRNGEQQQQTNAERFPGEERNGRDRPQVNEGDPKNVFVMELSLHEAFPKHVWGR
jgi:hypothetical protein